MAGYSNNFNDELRARLSIVDVIGRRVPLTKRGQNFWGCCPFHSEKTPSFSVNEQKGFYHCFGCGEHGDIISFIMKSQNMQYIDAIKELAQMAGLKMPEYKPKTPEQQQREQTYFEIMESATQAYQEMLWSPTGAAALEYVRKRGFTDEVIKKYRLGFAPAGNKIAAKFANQKIANVLATGLVRQNERGAYDFFRDRLMFPIFNPNGQVIAFSGRSMDGSEPKYINTTDTELFHKRRTVFGLNFARDAIYKANRSIVVEGQIDVIQMQTHGFPETVAPLGTALSEEHLQILCKSNRNIIFCFDGDGAGQKAAARALDLIAPLLRDNSDVRFVFLPKGLDPDDILRESGVGSRTQFTTPDSRLPTPDSRMKQIIDSAKPLVDFLWNFVNTNFNTRVPGGKAQAEKWIEKWLSKIPDLKFREMLRGETKNLAWQHWKKIKSKKEQDAESVKSIKVPAVDAISQKTLLEIAATYPELIEKHVEFLVKIGAKLDNAPNTPKTTFSLADAEKFIVALKLKNYINNLNADRVKALKGMTAESMERIKAIDLEIISAQEKLNKLLEI